MWSKYELTMKAAQSYKLFKQRYKRPYGKKSAKRGKKKQKVENVEEKGDVEQVEEAAPPQADDEGGDDQERKRKPRSDKNVPRNKITNLRVATSPSCVTTRQIKYNGKWHELVEVSNIIVFGFDMCVCVV